MRRLVTAALLAASVLVGASLATGLAQAGEALQIGMILPLSGAGTSSGQYQNNGAKLAVDEVNQAGGVLGRPIELVVEDDQTTNPGAVLAFSKLAGEPMIPAFVGPIRSTQIHAIAPDVLKLGKPVMIGGTDPALTHSGNPWLFRFRPNDSYSARVIADFGSKTLSKKKWAIVHSTDAFGTAGMRNLVEALKGLGIEPVLVQGYANNSQDFTPVAFAVKQSGAEVLGSYMTFDQDVGIFAKQLRQLGVNVTWIGSPTNVSTNALKLAGSALYGTFAVADFNRDSAPAAKAFASKYETVNKVLPDGYASWAYDAINVLALAINKAKSLEPDKIRAALLAVDGYEGAEGIYKFDKNGDGLHGYNIVRNKKGSIVFDQHVDFNE
jgi:branched-chain amino acid transport system substrate-binding protein